MTDIIETDNLNLTFELLPPDVQRTLIDVAIKEKTNRIMYEEIVYTLPNMIQLTYFCKKDSQSYPVRIYTVDLLKNGYASKILCPKCHKEIFVVHKTVPLDYALIKTTTSAKDIFDYLIE